MPRSWFRCLSEAYAVRLALELAVLADARQGLAVRPANAAGEPTASVMVSRFSWQCMLAGRPGGAAVSGIVSRRTVAVLSMITWACPADSVDSSCGVMRTARDFVVVVQRARLTIVQGKLWELAIQRVLGPERCGVHLAARIQRRGRDHASPSVRRQILKRAGTGLDLGSRLAASAAFGCLAAAPAGMSSLYAISARNAALHIADFLQISEMCLGSCETGVRTISESSDFLRAPLLHLRRKWGIRMRGRG
jgi:hypothetical protein